MPSPPAVSLGMTATSLADHRRRAGHDHIEEFRRIDGTNRDEEAAPSRSNTEPTRQNRGAVSWERRRAAPVPVLGSDLVVLCILDESYGHLVDAAAGHMHVAAS